MANRDRDFNPIVRLASAGRGPGDTTFYQLQDDLHSGITDTIGRKVELDLTSNTYQVISPTIEETILADFERGYYFAGDIITADRMAGDRWQVTSSGHYNAVGKLTQTMARGDTNRIMDVTKPLPGMAHTIEINDDPEQMIPASKTLASGISVHAIWVEDSWILSGFDCDVGTNTKPTAQPDSFTTPNNTVLNESPPGVLANDTDPNGDPLSSILVTDVSNGTLVFNADGSFDYTPSGSLTDATDSFTYKVNDGTEDGDTVTVTITVGSTNQAPVTVDDNFTVLGSKVLNVPAPGVLGNDIDVDGDPLTAVIKAGVSDGTLVFNTDGSFDYTPKANFSGTDDFKYRANDGIVDSDNVGIVTITVLPNQAPVSNTNFFSTPQDTVLNKAAPGVLVNDTDADDDPLSAVLVSGVSDGTLVLNADGSFDYTPNSGATGVDLFTYKANDGTDDGNTVIVAISVAAL